MKAAHRRCPLLIMNTLHARRGVLSGVAWSGATQSVHEILVTLYSIIFSTTLDYNQIAPKLIASGTVQFPIELNWVDKNEIRIFSHVHVCTNIRMSV